MLKDIPAQVYSGISFEKGVLPNLSILESCFIEDGLFINNKGDMPVIKRVSDYTMMIKDNIDNGNIISILESELKNEVRVFGKVAQIASEYQLVFEGKSGVQTRYGVNWRTRPVRLVKLRSSPKIRQGMGDSIAAKRRKA